MKKSHAVGPAHVTEEQNWPPYQWGTRSPWGVRLAKWRVRPAKERRASRGRRIRHNPDMPLVTKVSGAWRTEEIRWSSGHGFWPGQEQASPTPKPRARGFWVGESNYNPRLISATLEGFEEWLREQSGNDIREVGVRWGKVWAEVSMFTRRSEELEAS